MGGMAGVQEAMAGNPAMSGLAGQMGAMMEKMGMPGGADGVQNMMSQFTGQQAAAGAAAAGTEEAGRMMDSLTGNSAVTDTQEANARLMIRAMIQAAKADGEIDEAEREAILEHMGELEAGELDFVRAELAAPVDVEGLATDTSDQMKAQVYATSLMAIRVDHVREAQYLDALAGALDLSPEMRETVHRSMGVT